MAAFLDRISGLIKNILTHKRIEAVLKEEPIKKIYTKDILVGSQYNVGDYTYGHPNVLHWGEDARLIIGKFCSIADDVTIFLGGNHRSDWITTYPFPVLNKDFPEGMNITGHPISKGDVVIGNDVWIGHNATIMSGVKIGDGAVIGACAVVTKDISAYEIVAGNPARCIRKRFNDEVISQLLEIAWWNWSVERINSQIEYLCNPDINGFLQMNKK